MSIDINKFKKSLISLLPQQEKSEFLECNDSPLFAIMKYKPNVIAFAELNGNAAQVKETSSDFFRQKFIEKQREWNNYDLSLVYCLTSDKVDDALINEIQLDPYFCKKYVIDLTNKEGIENQFGHLPFIPLLAQTAKAITRPLSAKELLKQYNVKTELVNGLLNPGKMSPNKIISRCLEEKEISQWKKTKLSEHQIEKNTIQEIHQTRIKELQIENFRAYKQYDFDLDADVVVLYGNNGLGKTSFFEAIDFACTGSVLRLDEKFDVSSKLQRFNESLKYLNSNNIAETTATVNLMCNSIEKEFLRNLKDRSIAVTKKRNLNRKDTLQLITSPNDDLLTMSVENFVALFRASHMFGQDLSSLTGKKFKNESVLDEGIISRMLSFQDYTEGINKGKEVLTLLSRELKKEKDSITIQDIKINEKNNEIKTFDKKFTHTNNPQELGNIVQEALNSLKDKNKIKFPKEITSDFIKNIRANLQSDAKILNNSLNELNKAYKKFDQYNKEIANVEKIKKEINKANEQENAVDKKKITLESKILEVESDIKEFKMSKKENELDIKHLKWLLTNYSSYHALVDSINNQEKEVTLISEKLTNYYKELEKINNEKEKFLIKIAKNKTDLEQTEITLLEFADLKSKLNEYEIFNEKITEINNIKKQLNVKLEEFKKEFSNNNSKINTSTRNINAINEQIENLQNDQTELKTLLENIQKYILSKECPVCGHEYENKRELLERLQLRIGKKNDILDQLLKKKTELTKENRDLISVRRKYELDIKENSSQLESYEADIIDFKNKTQQIKKLAKNLEIQLDDMAVISAVNQKNENILNEKRKYKIESKNLTTLVENSEKTIRDIKLSIKESESRINSLNSLIIKDQNQKRKIDEYASGYKFTFLNKLEQIKNAETKLIDEDKKLEEKHKIAEKLLYDTKGQLKVNKDKSIEINKTLKNLQKTLVDSENIINEYDLLIKNFKLNKDASKSNIENLIDQSEIESENLNDAIKIINKLEITLEALQTSALVTKLKREVEDLIGIKKNNLEIIVNMEKWYIYFEKLVIELKDTRNKSIEEYINNLGPLSSKIQQRLRSVYNFGEIKLESMDGKVYVKTQHSGNELLPTDYFSESQIQILILSLFFSTALTQNWSAFSPILLDDPVTHFDDMNCYAFTDLIRGIVNTSNNKYQFIISTCEERLYALMKQKFKKMNGKAIFYEFKTIGKNGPIIEKFEFTPN